MARIKSGTIVSGLTAAAVLVIALLAVQASGSAPKTPPTAHQSNSANPAKKPTAKPAPPKTYPVPPHSGIGKRVVYDISAKRVWLVDVGNKVLRTYPVVAGNVAPSPGLHRVFSRRDSSIGGDGAKVEHVVLFSISHGINVGFSAAVDGSLTPPDPSKKTAAIRQSRADATALWQMATYGSAVDVVK